MHFILDNNFSQKEREKILIKYTENFYKTKEKEIKNGLRNVVKEWGKVENTNFKIIDKVFKKHSWPKGNYFGIVSIFWMYPRYISKKTFFFPYRHRIINYANRVISHEMLHFIFFDYIKKRYDLDEGAEFKNKHPEYLWRVSEVFNNIIENWEPYKKVSQAKSLPYNGTEKMFKKMKNQWQKKQDIDELLDKWLKI